LSGQRPMHAGSRAGGGGRASRGGQPLGLQPSASSMQAAAAALTTGAAPAKAKKRGKLEQPTADTPYTNFNVKNRVKRNCAPEQIEVWMKTKSAAPDGMFGDWSRFKCTNGDFLSFEVCTPEQCTPKWNTGVTRKYVQPKELQPPFPATQLRVSASHSAACLSAAIALAHPRVCAGAGVLHCVLCAARSGLHQPQVWRP
jgi:hypothetical protein